MQFNSKKEMNQHVNILLLNHKIGIFTVDLDFSKTKIEEEEEANVKKKMEEDEDEINRKFEDHLNREKRKNLKAEVISTTEGELYYAWEEFILQEEEFFEARKKFTEEFNATFFKGFEAYTAGHWDLAKIQFEQANVSEIVIII